MKLDATDVRYISSDEFRVLTAVEMGSKNHEVVPTPLIAQISGLRNGGVNKLIGFLARRNLIAKVQNATYDGYRLTYGGYDYLALRALSKRDAVYSVGNQIGVGKESDIHVVADAEGNQMVMKMHRLGRTSFRAIKSKRDYMGKRKSASWMYMSRLSAQKEWAFMKVLHEHGFPVPRPIDQARHVIIMEYLDAFPLRQLSTLEQPGRLYSTLMDLIIRLAKHGLIHGDFNEFNILINSTTGEPIVIDFPQMVSTSHANAEYYFNRDVECIRTFFKRRFGYESKLYPRFSASVAGGDEDEEGEGFRLDVVVVASGFKKKDLDALEEYMVTAREQTEDSQAARPIDEDSDEEEEEEEDEGSSEDDDDDAPNPRSRSRAPSPTSSCASELAKQVAGLNVSSPPLPAEAEPSSSPPLPLSLPSQPDLHGESGSDEDDEDGMAVDDTANAAPVLKHLVASEVSRQQQRQKIKYHSKKGGAGRARGSKAKNIKLSAAGVGDGW